MNKNTLWSRVRLGEICKFKYGKALPAEARLEGPYAVYGSNGPIGSHITALTSGPAVVIGRKGANFGAVHYSAAGCWPIDTAFFVDSTCTSVDLEWLAYRMSELDLNTNSRAAAIPSLSRDDAYKKSLLLPPIEEQRRIAEVLGQADDLRAMRRQAVTLLDSLTQSIFLDMFGDPMTNPHGYEITKMIDWIDPGRPITYGILKPGADQREGVKYVRVIDMKNKTIDISEIRRTSAEIAHQYRRSQLKTGDVLLSIRGHVGRLAEVPAELDGANITQDTARLAVPVESTLFVIECLRTPWLQHWMARHTKGAAVKGINLADVKEIPIPRPPIELQKKFADISRGLEGELDKNRSQLDELNRLFSSLQHQAFAGGL